MLEYNRLPMGLKCSPDIVQATMEKILAGLSVVVYIDNIGIWSNGSFSDHLAKVHLVLERLKLSGMKTNPLKCE